MDALIAPQTIAAYTKSLKDFGYSVTEEWVRREADALVQGQEPSVGDPGQFMSKFIAGWLDRHGLMEPRDGGS